MRDTAPLPKEICIIVTYRCNARCNMCDVFHHPSHPAQELTVQDIARLPSGLRFMNITGGEPFVRNDLTDIVAMARTKAARIVISTNGYFTDRIVDLCRSYPDLGIRISLEGLPKTNDGIRGIPDGFDRGLRTLLQLRQMGLKDIGFAMTVQDLNCKDLVPLYGLANALGYEFATATLHNSHYFCKLDNTITDVERVCAEFEKLIVELLASKSPKKWFRAYFNYGLMNYLKGYKRLLACEMGSDACFVDPTGDVLPCNGMNRKMPLGNIRIQPFEEIWTSRQADTVRQMVASCSKQCWMVGNAVPAIKKRLDVPLRWIVLNKLRMAIKQKPELSFPESCGPRECDETA